MAKYEAKFTKMKIHSYGNTFNTFLKRIINASKSPKFSTLCFKKLYAEHLCFISKESCNIKYQISY